MWKSFWNDYLTMKDLYKKSAVIATVIYGILAIGLVVLTKWDDIKSIFGKVIPKKSTHRV